MTNLLNIGRAGLASKNRPHFRAGGLYPNDCHLFSPLSVADALVVRGAIPLFSPRRVKTRGHRRSTRAYPGEI